MTTSTAAQKFSVPQELAGYISRERITATCDIETKPALQTYNVTTWPSVAVQEFE